MSDPHCTLAQCEWDRLYECRGFQSNVAHKCILLEYDFTSMGNWTPTFEGNVMSSVSKDQNVGILNLDPVMQYHIPEDKNPNTVFISLFA